MKRLMMKTIIDYQNDEREKVLLDVRDKQEFEKETYPGARNWYWEELIKVLEETPEEFTQQFDKSVPIYLLCYTGLHSDDLADILEEMGYEVFFNYFFLIIIHHNCGPHYLEIPFVMSEKRVALIPVVNTFD